MSRILCSLSAAWFLTACQPFDGWVRAPEDAQSAEPVAGMTMLRVSAGRAHACALMSDRTVRCWGHGAHGQLGIGSLPLTIGGSKPLRVGSLAVPTQVVGLADVAQIACGGDHSCALLSGGAVACWGSNAHGELGDGTTIARVGPSLVEGLTGATQIALGNGRSCARLLDGTVRCWGRNAQGELGDGTMEERHTPVPVAGLVGVSSVALGGAHTCAIVSGATFCWGANADGELGDGSTQVRPVPTRVPGLADVEQLALGDHHSCARLADGSARCWGCGEWGQVGDGTKVSRLRPQPVLGLVGAIDLAARNELTAASRHDGVMLVWGRVPFGTMRDEYGRMVPRDYVAMPSPLGDYSDVVEVTLGQAFGCARSIYGKVQCFGDNEFGQHGDGTFVTPTF